ncbi:MAG: hypothetical protein ACYTHM_12360 [Planctomycetota bacterium]|jgi:hypothetical protein
MARILYATCPHCRAFTALEERDVRKNKMVCFECNAEFPFERELLKTLDEIVEDREPAEDSTSSG